VFWRTLAVVAVLAAILVAVRHAGIGVEGAHVAKLSVSGIITDDEQLNAAVEKLADDDSVKALIVSIDSPGGSVAGGESLHDAIAHVAEKKPVVTVMGGIAASAGYMIAVPADRIFARAATLTGSIGVLLEAPDFSGLLGKLGIDADTLVSGPLKNQPSFTHPLSPAGRQVLQSLVMSMYDQFVAMVAAGRHMDPDKVRQLGDGRAYTGTQALQLGLIDQIGGERAARAWLASAKGVSGSLPVEDVTTDGFALRMFAGGIAPIFDGIWKTVISQSVSLDGAWAIWQRFGG
jgi:protease IV